MANSVLVLSWGSAKLALLAIVAIALFARSAPFLLPLLLPPPSFESLLLLSTLLTPGSVFVLANCIVLAILISSGFLQPSNFFASCTSFPSPQPGFNKPLSRKLTESGDDPLKNQVRSQALAGIPAVPLRKQWVIVPESSSQKTRIILDQSQLHLVEKLPLATANHLSTIKEPKQAFATSATTGARIVRSTSDHGVRANMVAADRGKILRKAESMNCVSVVWRSPDTDRLFSTNACLSPVDFHRKCEDFIARVHLDMRKDT